MREKTDSRRNVLRGRPRLVPGDLDLPIRNASHSCFLACVGAPPALHGRSRTRRLGRAGDLSGAIARPTGARSSRPRRAREVTDACTRRRRVDFAELGLAAADECVVATSILAGPRDSPPHRRGRQDARMRAPSRPSSVQLGAERDDSTSIRGFSSLQSSDVSSRRPTGHVCPRGFEFARTADVSVLRLGAAWPPAPAVTDSALRAGCRTLASRVVDARGFLAA